MSLRAIVALSLLSLIAGRTSVAVCASLAASGAEAWLNKVVATNAIAVADFEMADPQRGTEDRAFGLADVLSVELSQ